MMSLKKTIQRNWMTIRPAPDRPTGPNLSCRGTAADRVLSSWAAFVQTKACRFRAVQCCLLQRHGGSRSSAGYRSPVFKALAHDLAIMTRSQSMLTRTEVVRYL